MSKAGQSNYKGINSQAFAALSLLLQNSLDPEFQEIILEGDKLEDFVLVYTSGKRVICESKDYKAGLKLSDLKRILDTVIDNNKIEPHDELLIISSNTDAKVKSVINNLGFLTDKFKQDLQTKPPKFEEKHFKLLAQTKLWDVSQIENREGILLLMSVVLNLNGRFWAPKKVIEDWVNSLLIKGIYEGSQVGKKISKAELLNTIEERKKEHINLNGSTYESLEKADKKRVRELIDLVTQKKPGVREVSANAISELTINPTLHYEALRRLRQRSDLELADWEQLWLSTTSSPYPYILFDIFQQNLTTPENIKYVLDFLNKVLDGYLVNYYRKEFVKKDIVDVLNDIFKGHNGYEKEVVELIKKLFKFNPGKFLYQNRNGNDIWEREEVVKVLKDVYMGVKDSRLKSEIIDFIWQTFNLIEDDGKYWHYTPPQIFEILALYSKEAPVQRIPWLIDVIAKQFNWYYGRFGKTLKFEGWELIGSGISNLGGDYAIDDRHFIQLVVRPAIDAIPPSDAKWNFAKDFLTTDIKSVSQIKPDYMNRALIPYLLEMYSTGDFESEAFDKLKALMTMSKGIPWKPDVIFSALKKSAISEDKKWALIQYGLDSFKGQPLNIFVRQIVTDLATSAVDPKIRDKAIATLKAWSKQEVSRRITIGEFGEQVDNILALINNPQTFNDGIEILKELLESKEYIELSDIFSAWATSKVLAKVLSLDFNVAIEFLKTIDQHPILSVSQQITRVGFLNEISDDDKPQLLKAYEEIVQPLLKEYPDNASFEKRFPCSSAREILVQFSEKLVKVDEHEKALNIIGFFINDSDPPVGNEIDQKVVEGDDNPVITFVRGQCAWVLRRFSTLPARDSVPKALALVSKLTEDSSPYIRAMSTYALSEFARNRNTYLPNTDPKQRFLPITIAEEIESMAFRMLDEHENQKIPAILKGLLHVFDHMRVLDDKRAFKVLKIFINSGFDMIQSEVAALMLFFAEFRKDAFKNWVWGKLPEFDDKNFKDLLIDSLKTGNKELRQSLAWQFWKLPQGQEVSEEERRKYVKLAIKYFNVFLQGDYDHEVWGTMYRFIDDFLPLAFDECYELWQKCLEKEKPILTKLAQDPKKIWEINWWPNHSNGDLLLQAFSMKGEQDFVKWLKFISEYPLGLQISGDLEKVVEKLQSLPKGTLDVEYVFDKLIERDPSFYESKQKWLDQVAKADEMD